MARLDKRNANNVCGVCQTERRQQTSYLSHVSSVMQRLNVGECDKNRSKYGFLQIDFWKKMSWSVIQSIDFQNDVVCDEFKSIIE